MVAIRWLIFLLVDAVSLVGVAHEAEPIVEVAGTNDLRKVSLISMLRWRFVDLSSLHISAYSWRHIGLHRQQWHHGPRCDSGLKCFSADSATLGYVNLYYSSLARHSSLPRFCYCSSIQFSYVGILLMINRIALEASVVICQSPCKDIKFLLVADTEILV